VLTEPRYLSSLISTVLLAAATTVATLVISGISGVFLTRHRFRGRDVLTALLTLPLAFPGVVIGFMVIMLAGRQGLIPDITDFLSASGWCSRTRWRGCSSATCTSRSRARS
jgi:putative spermidine/putrescine transport system permease protein